MTDEQQSLEDHELGLGEMITALRSELLAAQWRAQGEELRFGVAEVEVEAAVEITNNAGGKAGVQFWVVQAGGEFTHARSSTHRVTMKLTLPPGTQVSDKGDDAE
ncbi:trypco2 family protein [Streptomyces sp. NPDC006655]|uniref:trypco2 family protein n=1 Tax=Streptomyces sp. NPDC006655 TaxID=3156898 RepID=UPI003455A586